MEIRTEVKTELLESAAYYYVHANKIPLRVFESCTLQEVVKYLEECEHIKFPTTIGITRFPTYEDYSTYDSMDDISVIIYETSKMDGTLAIPFDRNGNIWDDEKSKIVDLFNWYCKELAKGTIKTFEYDLRRNRDYLMMLAKYYGVEDTIKSLFLEYNTCSNSELKLETLKDFIECYRHIKNKHPMKIQGIH